LGKEGNQYRRWIFLFRLLSISGRQAALAIEINPVCTSASVTKKRDVVIRSALELEEIIHLLNHEKLSELDKKIDEVNPEKRGHL
jgi:hypothetical protein